MTTCVWAFRPLPELKHQTGFVECDDELAARLLAAGFVQDPRIGATPLNEISAAPPPPPTEPMPHPTPLATTDEYDTKVVTAKPPRSSTRK